VVLLIVHRLVTQMSDLSTSPSAYRASTRELMLVTIAIFLQVFLSALDTTIIGTAMPTVVAALGGLNLYSWVFSAYMLTSTVSTPIAGKLSDQLSRKRLYLSGIAGFVISSWLCGLSQNLITLIIFRSIQGLAAGAMIAVSMGLIAVLYPPEKRGRMQGMLASVWAVTSMFGPLLGGFVVEHFSWRWAFYLNLPLGVVAWFFVKRYLHETEPSTRNNGKSVQVDYFGATVLIAGVVSFLLAITDEIHAAFVWRVALLAVSLIALITFIQIERRTAEPILPLNLLRRREIAAANLTTFITAIGMFGMIILRRCSCRARARLPLASRHGAHPHQPRLGAGQPDERTHCQSFRLSFACSHWRHFDDRQFISAIALGCRVFSVSHYGGLFLRRFRHGIGDYGHYCVGTKFRRIIASRDGNCFNRFRASLALRSASASWALILLQRLSTMLRDVLPV
jgi:MFS family permease